MLKKSINAPKRVASMREKIVTVFPFADPDIKYTMMDNYLFDHIMPVVKPNAWKILCLIIRKTKGWHKISDQISFSQIKAGTGISSDETVSNALKQLVSKRYIMAKKGGQWDATEYEINANFSTTIIEVERETTTEIEVAPTTEIVVAPTTIIEDTKETPLNKDKDKQLSADADCSLPISLLSEKEVKALKLPLSAWLQHLADEQAERKRSGVIKFLENKISTGPLLPDTPAAHTFFDKLAIEAEAKGRRPPQKFPTLAVKEKFNTAADSLNGTLEGAINKALENGITSIPRIVNYISSPKWKDDNGQRSAKNSQRQTDRKTGKKQGSRFSPPAGSGQSPEMARRIREAFAPTPK
jgi:phage replication O-like protein O